MRDDKLFMNGIHNSNGNNNKNIGYVTMLYHNRGTDVYFFSPASWTTSWSVCRRCRRRRLRRRSSSSGPSTTRTPRCRCSPCICPPAVCPSGRRPNIVCRLIAARPTRSSQTSTAAAPVAQTATRDIIVIIIIIISWQQYNYIVLL